jgi:hypothetical protein
MAQSFAPDRANVIGRWPDAQRGVITGMTLLSILCYHFLCGPPPHGVVCFCRTMAVRDKPGDFPYAFV